MGSSYVLGPRDRMCILHRDLGAHFVRGVTPDRYLANYMGRAGGVTGGKDGNMHFGDRRLGCVGMVSMLPDMARSSTGLALAFKMRARAARRDDLLRRGLDRKRPVPRGAQLRGHPSPAGGVRAREQPASPTRRRPTSSSRSIRSSGPRATASPASRWTATTSRPCSRRLAWPPTGHASGDGPTLIECHTMRMHGHGAHDDMSYVPKELLEEWEARDPIERVRRTPRRDVWLLDGRGRDDQRRGSRVRRRVRAQGTRFTDARCPRRARKASSPRPGSHSATATPRGRAGTGRTT